MKGQPAALNVFLVYALFYMYSNFDNNFNLYILKYFYVLIEKITIGYQGKSDC